MNIKKWTLTILHILVRVIKLSVCRWLNVHGESADGECRLGKDQEHTYSSIHMRCLGEHMLFVCVWNFGCWCEQERSEGCSCLLSVVIFSALVDQSGKLLFSLLIEVRSKTGSDRTGNEYDVLRSLVKSLVVQGIAGLLKQCSVWYVWNECYPGWLWVLTQQVFF